MALLSRRTTLIAALAAVSVPAFAQEKPGAASHPPPPLKGLVRKGYASTPLGQIHYRMVTPEKDTGKAPIVFFHPNPFSSRYFVYILEEMGRDRVAIAFDTPGYGESDKPQSPLSMEQLVAGMAAALENLGFGEKGKGKVDVSGYHTGAYIATEITAARPDLVRRAVLVGVPFWEGEELEKQRKRLLVDKPLSNEPDHVLEEWKSWVVNRNPAIPVDRAYDLFVESLRSGAEKWWAYNAVLNYNARVRYQAITQPVLLLNTAGGLAPFTRNILPLLKKGKLVEVTELTNGIWDVGPDIMGRYMRDYLDKPA
jgi:pimeloyl-ACP methyl ester carboxylesterase